MILASVRWMSNSHKVIGVIPDRASAAEGERFRHLQTTEGIVFPEIITSSIMEWIEAPLTSSLSTDLKACEAAFEGDNPSLCQCFFSVENRRGGGVPVTAFAPQYRCPATINCILSEPISILWNLYESPSLIDGWRNDLACPFVECLWWDPVNPPPNPTATDLGTPYCLSVPGLCGLHEGAAFCVRTDDATDSTGTITGHVNQVGDGLPCNYICRKVIYNSGRLIVLPGRSRWSRYLFPLEIKTKGAFQLVGISGVQSLPLHEAKWWSGG